MLAMLAHSNSLLPCYCNMVHNKPQVPQFYWRNW